MLNGERQQISDETGGPSVPEADSSNLTPEEGEGAPLSHEEEIDLNRIFPEEETDLNTLFPDQEMKHLLKKVQKNKKDLTTLRERFDEGK